MSFDEKSITGGQVLIITRTYNIIYYYIVRFRLLNVIVLSLSALYLRSIAGFCFWNILLLLGIQITNSFTSRRTVRVWKALPRCLMPTESGQSASREGWSNDDKSQYSLQTIAKGMTGSYELYYYYCIFVWSNSHRGEVRPERHR